LDLDEFPLSPRIKDDVITALRLTSKEFGIPVSLLHLVIRVESDYRFNIDHKLVTIKVKGRDTKIQAKGLGGIVWELWADSLQTYGIAASSTDLYLPDVNIKAMGFILRDCLRKESGSDPNVSTIISRVVRRYFGAFSKDYEDKLLRDGGDFALRRIARDLVYQQQGEKQ
jgi:hypothetical protein